MMFARLKVWAAVLLGAVVLILTFGRVKLAQGRAIERAARAEANAKAHQETTERVLHETASNDPADRIRQRMSDRAGKP